MNKNNIVLVTGGSSGLGFGLARDLLKRGAGVILLARNLEKLEKARETLHGEFRDRLIDTVSVDVTDADAVATALPAVIEKHPSLDMVINNAGIMREGYFESLDIPAFQTVMNANFFGCIYVTRTVLPYLKASRGRLVNIASVAGLTGVFGYTPYCSAKHALVGLTESLRYELKPQGITVHLVCPPEFDSPMVDDLDAYRTPENRAHTLMIPKLPLDVVVKDTMKGIEKNRFRIIPGFQTRLMVFGMQHFPAISRRMADLKIRRCR